MKIKLTWERDSMLCERECEIKKGKMTKWENDEDSEEANGKMGMVKGNDKRNSKNLLRYFCDWMWVSMCIRMCVCLCVCVYVILVVEFLRRTREQQCQNGRRKCWSVQEEEEHIPAGVSKAERVRGKEKEGVREHKHGNEKEKLRERKLDRESNLIFIVWAQCDQ